MPAEAWVALGTGVTAILCTVIGAVWYLAYQVGRSTTEISRMKVAIEKLEEVMSAIAVDRANFGNSERRTDERFKTCDQLIAALRHDLEELRRGDGFIRLSEARR